MKKPMIRRATMTLLAASIAAASTQVSAYSLIDQEDTKVNLDIEAIVGTFSSQEGYATAPSGEQGKSYSWQEGYVKAGLSGEKTLTDGTLYGGISLVTSGVWGDGDAAGFTVGDERETSLEDLYIGFRKGAFDLSVGAQNFAIGDGFLINGDALSFGDGFNDVIPGIPDFNRGGAYWLAPRKSFNNTAILRVEGKNGLRGDLFWLQSGNPAQASVEFTGINVEHTSDMGTVAATYFQGTGVEKDEAEFLGLTHRDGQKNLSLRFQGNAGVENLFLSAEYVNQTQGDDTRKDGNAFYAEAGWTFSDVAWSPSVNYRFSSFEEGFDPLLYGVGYRGLGTWFQGEVGGSYAGPFNSHSDVHYLAVKAAPSETLSLSATYFGFEDTNGTGDNDGSEIDIYAEWVANDNLILVPLLGLYTPDSDKSAQGNTDTNTYFQMMAVVLF